MKDQELLSSQEAQEIIALLKHYRDTPIEELDSSTLGHRVSASAARKFLVLLDSMEAERKSADYGTAVGHYIHLNGKV